MKTTNDRASAAKEDAAVGKFVQFLFDVLSKIPVSKETAADNPANRCKKISSDAAAKAASVAGTLALPPGPLGLLTIIPDLVAIWKIQSRMVADIAAVYGKTARLSRDSMIYCLFRHTASFLVRDVVVRAGERMAVLEVSSHFSRQVIEKVGVRMLQRGAGKTIMRWVPIVGAAGVGAYAYWDTSKVAKSAVGLFGATEIADAAT